MKRKKNTCHCLRGVDSHFFRIVPYFKSFKRFRFVSVISFCFGRFLFRSLRFVSVVSVVSFRFGCFVSFRFVSFWLFFRSFRFVSSVSVVSVVSFRLFRPFRWFRSFRFRGFVSPFRVLVHAKLSGFSIRERGPGVLAGPTSFLIPA